MAEDLFLKFVSLTHFLIFNDLFKINQTTCAIKYFNFLGGTITSIHQHLSLSNHFNYARLTNNVHNEISKLNYISITVRQHASPFASIPRIFKMLAPTF